jgi:hypothetical protein
MHLLSSTSGASNPCCIKAFTGHTLTDGQEWFCGHLFLSTTIAIYVSPFRISFDDKSISFLKLSVSDIVTDELSQKAE